MVKGGRYFFPYRLVYTYEKEGLSKEPFFLSNSEFWSFLVPEWRMLTKWPEYSWSIQPAIRNRLFQKMIDVTGEKLDIGDCNSCGCIIVLVSTKLFCLNFWWGKSYQKLAYLMNLACCTCSRERVEPARNVVLETFLTTCIDIIVRLNYYQKMARNSWTVWSLLFEQRSPNLLNLLAFETWDNSIILTGVGLRLLQSLEPQPFKKAWPVKDKQV